MPTLLVSNLSAGYGKGIVVNRATLSVDKGELCALLGLNGCGKTTLLKTVCGLLPLREGKCLVNDEDCSKMNERQRALRMSYIPQRGSLISGKTVLEVILMGANARLHLLDAPGNDDRRMAYAAMEDLGIQDYADRNYEMLSEGQKQLVILARSLVQDAPVMLMDEPDSALDFVNRNMVMEKLRSILKEKQKAGLVTLHDPNFALSYCDCLLLMKDGVILEKLVLKSAEKSDVERALSAVYGNVRVIEHPKGYVMINA